MEFTEKELFCLARHLIAQHYEEKYPLTYISLYNDGVERYKRRKEHEKMTTEEIEKAKKEYQAHATYLEQMVKEKSNDKENLLNEMRIINEENRKLKRGIINFIRGLGG